MIMSFEGGQLEYKMSIYVVRQEEDPVVNFWTAEFMLKDANSWIIRFIKAPKQAKHYLWSAAIKMP